MILAVGQGEQRMIVVDGHPTVAIVMSAIGSFDHRAMEGADAARFMQAFKAIVETRSRYRCDAQAVSTRTTRATASTLLWMNCPPN